MSGTSFHIDLDEVEAAAKQIRAMLDDLDGPTAKLEAVINQIKPAAYGTDKLGKALQGGSSAVGGLADHQAQVLKGIRQYLDNSAKMAENLATMCAGHRETDDQQASEFKRILNDGGTPISAMPGAEAGTRLRTGIGPVVVPAAAAEPLTPVAGPGPVISAPEPVTPVASPAVPDSGYHDPAAPTLDYDKPAPKPDPAPRGGGGGHQLI